MEKITRSLISRVEYRAALSSAKPEIITIGYTVEMGSENSVFLAAIRRSALTPEELAKLDSLAREQLADTGDFITKLWNMATEKSPGSINEYLSSVYSWAVHVTAPESFTVPASFSDLANPKMRGLLQAWTKRKLLSLVEQNKVVRKRPRSKKKPAVQALRARRRAAPAYYLNINTRIQEPIRV